MPVRIIIVDDHRLVLDALERILEADDDTEVVGTARDGEEVLELVGRTRPDMVLMDVHMPGMDGLSCLDLLREHHPTVEVVLISAGADEAEIGDALRRGASGYLVKSINPNDVPAALRQIHERTAFSAAAGPAAATPAPSPGLALAQEAGLTPRELEMLTAVARGLSNRQIAKELWVTEQTVKFHLGNVYRKLDVTTRAEALVVAMRAGLEIGEDASVRAA
ncbi:MAG TPA: response regulator transcription factor [Solirubrobacteraceae bacterium]|nr:response regulator transcription factor [Solirubrobacteraceae bacterium]